MQNAVHLALIAAIVCLSVRNSQAAPLVISYVEKPPYYYTDRDQPAGFLLNTAQQVFDKAGIPVQWVSRPAKRALLEVEQATVPLCSIGWFKTSERLAFASFSLPIHQDKPMAVLVNQARAPAFRQYGSLRELMADRRLRPAVVTGFSYGREMDQWLGERAETVERAAVTPIINLKKLLMGRIDFTIVDVQELDYLYQQADISRNALVEIQYPDMPDGGIRYLMCSKNLDEGRMNRINAAIRLLKLVPEHQVQSSIKAKP